MGARSILDLYIHIGPPRILCLARMCRLVWDTVAYTAAPLVDWRSENVGQNGWDNPFCQPLVLIVSIFQVDVGVQL